jgi:hypothetical protein
VILTGENRSRFVFLVCSPKILLNLTGIDSVSLSCEVCSCSEPCRGLKDLKSCNFWKDVSGGNFEVNFAEGCVRSMQCDVGFGNRLSTSVGRKTLIELASRRTFLGVCNTGRRAEGGYTLAQC